MKSSLVNSVEGGVARVELDGGEGCLTGGSSGNSGNSGISHGGSDGWGSNGWSSDGMGSDGWSSSIVDGAQGSSDSGGSRVSSGEGSSGIVDVRESVVSRVSLESRVRLVG